VTNASTTAEPDTEQILWMYRRMVTIREFEEAAGRQAELAKIPGAVHLYAGEEAVAVGVCANLERADAITSTHRGHGHCIAKGVDVNGMLAELFGRTTGICKGKGGSMHIADLDCGMLGANGIVGAGIPLTSGAALTAKIKKTGTVAVGFFGDGATNQGQFHKALNIAAIWELPAVFVIENNGYGEATPTEFVTPFTDLARRADAFAMDSATADGMDFFDVYEKAGEAIELARKGEGPTLLECKTYRYYDHVGRRGMGLNYRSDEEVEEWMKRDPIDLFEARLSEQGIMSADDLAGVHQTAQDEIEAAVKFADESPMPDPSTLLDDVYYVA